MNVNVHTSCEYNNYLYSVTQTFGKMGFSQYWKFVKVYSSFKCFVFFLTRHLASICWNTKFLPKNVPLQLSNTRVNCDSFSILCNSKNLENVGLTVCSYIYSRHTTMSDCLFRNWCLFQTLQNVMWSTVMSALAENPTAVWFVEMDTGPSSSQLDRANQNYLHTYVSVQQDNKHNI